MALEVLKQYFWSVDNVPVDGGTPNSLRASDEVTRCLGFALRPVLLLCGLGWHATRSFDPAGKVNDLRNDASQSRQWMVR